MIDVPDIVYRMALSMLPNMHRTNASRLESLVGGDVRRFFEMTPTQLQLIAGLSRRYGDEAVRRKAVVDALSENEFVRSHRIDALWHAGDAYPRRMVECDDAPALLYKLGSANLDACHVVAIVGTRRPSVYGLRFVANFVKELAAQVDDLLIVSGLAYGIDVAAHRAALENGVPTAAVQATPMNTVYPADHRDVAKRIIESGGTLVTEYSTHAAMHRGNFLARNRIIASLCDATIVVESDIKGGAMATARMAAAYNRQVFALPGRVTDDFSRGTNRLIADNVAQMLLSTDEFIDAVGWKRRERATEQRQLVLEFSEVQQRILDALREHPEFTVNELVRHLGMPYAALTDQLFQLEMADVIVAVPGGHYAVV